MTDTALFRWKRNFLFLQNSIVNCDNQFCRSFKHRAALEFLKIHGTYVLIDRDPLVVENLKTTMLVHNPLATIAQSSTALEVAIAFKLTTLQ